MTGDVSATVRNWIQGNRSSPVGYRLLIADNTATPGALVINGQARPRALCFLRNPDDPRKR